MPIYEFECQKCGAKKELFTSSHNGTNLPACSCGGEFKKIISQTSFVLKGSGWYATDYGKGNKSGVKSQVCNSCDKKNLCGTNDK